MRRTPESGFASFKVLPLVALLTASASADPVTLPYVSPDGGSGQWFVQQMGVLQQQGNQPVFSQAGMLTVNGQHPQRSTNTVDYDEKTKELTFPPAPAGAVRVSRRIRFDESGVVRVIDIFDNPLDREVSINILLMTSTNFGVNDTQAITDPKRKEGQIGWAANTGAERAAMSLFGGKGSKTVPAVQFQPNSNSVTATLTLKIPGKSRQAVVHWHGTFDNADAGVQWAGQLKEAKALADLPIELRRVLVNAVASTSALPEGLELLSGGATDVVELRGGDVLRGTLGIDAYDLSTDYGDVSVPAAEVTGLLGIGESRQWLVTRAGELLAGRLRRATVPITLAGGQTAQVPLERVARLGYRNVPAEITEWKFDRPMAFLATGERFLIDPPTGSFDFVTRYGPLTLSVEQIATVLLSPAAAAHQVYLADGSRLSGVLTGATMPLRRAGVPATQPVNVPTAALARVQLQTVPESTTAGAATLGLLGDDIIAARIDGTLSLVTPYDTLTINGPEIRSMSRARANDTDVQITTADGSTFRGALRDRTLNVTLRSGPKLTLPVAAVRDYDNPSPLPAAALVSKATDAIGRLNSDDWKTREAAEAELTAAGPNMVGVMNAALPTQAPEARDRLRAIVKVLTKDQSVPASRLTPPPME
ncbi:MAG TPA: hypothetical protein VF595_00210 [Tepidisphaeraceae bacterium]|jgi:hypothetical protein